MATTIFTMYGVSDKSTLLTFALDVTNYYRTGSGSDMTCSVSAKLYVYRHDGSSAAFYTSYRFNILGQTFSGSNERVESGYMVDSHTWTTTAAADGCLHFSGSGGYTSFTSTGGSGSCNSDSVTSWHSSFDKWVSPAEYTITYNLNGSYYTSKTATYGSSVSAPSYPDSSYPSSSSDSTFVITGNVNGGVTPNKTLTATKTVTTSYTRSGSWWSGTATGNKTSNITYTSSTSTTYKNNTLGGLASPTRNDDVTTANITLKYNNGSSNGSLSVTSVKSYTFKGWHTNSGSTTTLDSSTSYTSATTVYAIWEEKITNNTVDLPTNVTKTNPADSFTVKLNMNGGTSSNQSYNVSKSYSYTFNGWHKDGVKVSNTYQPSSYVNHTLEAKFTQSTSTGSITLPTPSKADAYLSSYKVTLNANGGSVSSTSLTARIATHYKFVGWNNESTNTFVAAGGAKYTPTASINLIAIWEVSGTTTESVTLPRATKDMEYNSSYTVTLNANGGSVSSTKLTARIGTIYSFQEWRNSAGNRVAGAGAYTPTSDITLIAYYTSTNDTESITLPRPTRSMLVTGQVTTKFNANGGSSTPSSITSDIGTAYQFVSWNNSSTNAVVSGAGAYTPTGNITLIAKWNEVSGYENITLPTISREYHTFMGWSKNKTAVAGESGVYQNTYPATENATLYAVFAQSIFIKTYLWHDGAWWRILG